jgi:predicted regulator of Ras-like GTPase activity (Roadblock/LC7/MglB family)
VELENVLEELELELSDFCAAAVVGLDGLSIAEVSADGDMDITEVSAEFASVINSLAKTSLSINAGSVTSTLESTAKYHFLTQMVDDYPYFLVVVIGSNGNIGKARYMMNRVMPVIKEIIQ